jgi:hypothetical protein
MSTEQDVYSYEYFSHLMSNYKTFNNMLNTINNNSSKKFKFNLNMTYEEYLKYFKK